VCVGVSVWGGWLCVFVCLCGVDGCVCLCVCVRWMVLCVFVCLCGVIGVCFPHLYFGHTSNGFHENDNYVSKE